MVDEQSVHTDTNWWDNQKTIVSHV